MKYISVPETTFETLIEGLEAALNVCYNVDYRSDEAEKSSAYACGYCRSTLQMTIDNLKYIKS